MSDSVYSGSSALTAESLSTRKVLTDLLSCCLAWEPQVCVMGNVTAGDAADALANVLGIDSPGGALVDASPLTDEDIAALAERMEATDPPAKFWREFARAVETHIRAFGVVEARRISDPEAADDVRLLVAHIASTPEKARAFLQDAGILDERGELAEPYRES